MASDSNPDLGAFTLAVADVDLPKGAFAGGRRRILRHEGRPVLSMTEGRFRSYLHPVWTPEGVAVTAEAPADHPHHTGLWCAADHIHAMMPTATGHEVYTYNLYVEDVFQGRAPGSIRETGVAATLLNDDAVRLSQTLEWRGPREWAAPAGRIIFNETRYMDIRRVGPAHVIDMACLLMTPEFAVELGPTRHGYFNARVSESISLAAPAGVSHSDGRTGGNAITGDSGGWVDWSGPAGHGQIAGLAMMPDAATSGGWWFATDWGVMTTGPFRWKPLRVEAGETRRFSCRYIAHDLGPKEAGLDPLFAEPPPSMPS